jgi:hypothetical protein
MYDLEAAADRLRKACYQDQVEDAPNEGPKELTFFLLDNQNGGWGLFCWYETQEELRQALRLDLVGFMHSPDEEEDAAEFLKQIADLIDNIPEGVQFSDSTRGRIDDLLVAPWRIPYIGTYSNLLSSNGEWERNLRTQFREHMESDDDHSPSDAAKAAPIKPKERTAFDAFVTAPVV